MNYKKKYKQNRKSRYFVMNRKSLLKNSKNIMGTVYAFANICGILIAVLIIKRNGNNGAFYNVSAIITSFLSQKGVTNGGYTAVLGSLFAALSIYFGFSVIGAGGLPALHLMNGLGYGYIVTYFYTTYRLRGLGFIATVIVPCGILSTIALIISSKESHLFSVQLKEKGLTEQTKNGNNRLAVFAVKQGIVLLICALSAGTQIILSRIFLVWFPLTLSA